MCLATVDKNLQPCEEGYKVFSAKADAQGNTHLVGDIISNKPLPRGVWLDERDFRPCYMLHKKLIRQGILEHGIKYPAGWHTYHDLVDAEVWAKPGQVCLRVQVRQPKTTGFQNILSRTPVTISRYIRIPKQ